MRSPECQLIFKFLHFRNITILFWIMWNFYRLKFYWVISCKYKQLYFELKLHEIRTAEELTHVYVNMVSIQFFFWFQCE